MDSAPTATLRKVHRKRGLGSYKGVRMRSLGRWVSEIRIPKTKRRIWLGSYDAPEKAARAYDAALYCVRGARGRFNFPADKKPELPDGLVGSLSKADIKAIAESFTKLDSLVPLPMSSSMTPVLSSDVSVFPAAPVSSDIYSARNTAGGLLVQADVPAMATILPEGLQRTAVPAMATILPESLQLDDLILDIDLIREFH